MLINYIKANSRVLFYNTIRMANVNHNGFVYNKYHKLPLKNSTCICYKCPSTMSLPFSKLVNHNGNVVYRSVSTDATTSSFLMSYSSFFNYLSQSTPVAYAKDLIVSFHDFTSLPWWTSIVLLTFLLRLSITLPLALYQSLILAKVENLAALEMPELAAGIKKETALKVKDLNWTEKEAALFYKKAVKKQWDTLIIRDNCHPFKATITLWFQVPTWIFFSTALRNLSYMLPVGDADAQILFLQLGVGGFLWIPNLTQPDGTLILPVLLGLSNLTVIEIQSMMRLRKPTRLQRYATNFFRFFSIILIPISATVPSSVALYWTTSSLLGLGQNLLLMSNKLKSLCKIPDTPTTLDHPYLQLIEEIKQKGKIFRTSKYK